MSNIVKGIEELLKSPNISNNTRRSVTHKLRSGLYRNTNLIRVHRNLYTRITAKQEAARIKKVKENIESLLKNTNIPKKTRNSITKRITRGNTNFNNIEQTLSNDKQLVQNIKTLLQDPNLPFDTKAWYKIFSISSYSKEGLLKIRKTLQQQINTEKDRIKREEKLNANEGDNISNKNWKSL
jgi:hypothetical protein